jgi:protein SCO1/2
MINREHLQYVLLVGLLIGVPALAFVGMEAYSNWQKSLPIEDPEPNDGKPHTIPDFAFVNQLGDTVTQDDFADKVYVANFFFTACPSTCPPMMENLTKVQKAFKQNDRVALLSHTVDPKRDTVEALQEYAEEYGVNADQWDLVTGNKTPLYNMARNGYDVVSLEGSGRGPAGFVHSSKVILVDRQQRIRGYYDGTEESAIDRLIKDIRFLLKKSKNKQPA